MALLTLTLMIECIDGNCQAVIKMPICTATYR